MSINKNRNFSISKEIAEGRREQIDQLVDKVRKQIQYLKPPLDLNQIEINIPEIQICEQATLPVASEIFYIDRTRKIAQVNIRAKDLKAAKILTTCHALGHYFLHPNSQFSCRLDFYGENNTEELEATYFAETLLMPNSLIGELYRSLKSDFDPIYKLAKTFAVKRQIIEDRLSSLKLL